MVTISPIRTFIGLNPKFKSKKHNDLEQKLLLFILLYYFANPCAEFVEYTCADTQ